MYNAMAVFFMAGWFDTLEKRLGYMEAYDNALQCKRKTKLISLRFDSFLNTIIIEGR